jgi:hypothetical protein
MTGVLSGVAASGELFEHLEEFEHAGERRSVLGIGARGGDLALEAVVRGPGDVKEQPYGPPRC